MKSAETNRNSGNKGSGIEKLLLLFGAVVITLSIALLVIYSLIRLERSKAVRQYNEENWATIEKIANGRSIYGMSGGKEFGYLDNGTYFDGIYVDGVKLKGMTYEQAREALIKVVEDKLNGINMVVSVGDASLALNARDFNISINVNEILDKAYQLGRENLNDYAANYRKQQSLIENPVEYHIEYSYDKARIEQYVASIAEFVNTKPKEPYITVSQRPSANSDSGGKSDDPIIRDTDTIVQTVKAANGEKIAYIYYNPGKNGYVLNEEDLVSRIIEAFENDDYDCVLTAELEETEPSQTPSDLKDRISLITKYTSEFDKNKENRSRNVQKAAGILNGCVVKPGQEISFNKYVGPRTEAGGWLRAPGITGGKEYEDSPGGGICQVSGTLYNALLQCGPNKIKITKRQHHSWPSTYVPFGLDATVDTNGPDLKWMNVSDDPIYIFTYADMQNGVMYVYIYGVPEEDGSYFETYAEIIEEVEPEEAVIVKNPSWPTGYEKETIKARVGYKTKAYLYHYSKEGELLNTIYLYTDYYYPVQGEITVGTGPEDLPKPKF
ncbi:MAG: VanW family protein [Clostridiales bacterium]|nr:VanW family protein [Clostridiales bacterium]